MAEFLEWSDSDSVGDDAADRAHRKIIQVVNLFLNALVQGKAEKILESLLDQIIAVVQDHFKSEENVLNRHIDRPLFIRHKDDDQRIVKELRMLRTGFARAGLGIDDVLPFFQEWVFKHIRELDQPCYRQVPPSS